MSTGAKRIFVAGHNGMVGAALVRRLSASGNIELIKKSREDLNLFDRSEVNQFFREYRVDEIYMAAARVGGIYANNMYPADFIYDNLMIAANVVEAAHQHDVQKLLFLGSSCIYPRRAPQPIPESALLSGALEPTNEPYAIAKIAGIKLCESFNRQYGRDYRSVMPTNLYGPGDNFHTENSHVVPALIRRFHEAKEAGEPTVTVWGSGAPRREFLHVDDLADACVHVMNLERQSYDGRTEPTMSHINVGTGVDCTIAELAQTISDIVGFPGDIIFDASKPDGAPRKLLDVRRMRALGWEASIPLREGLEATYQWFADTPAKLRL